MFLITYGRIQLCVNWDCETISKTFFDKDVDIFNHPAEFIIPG